MRFTWKKTVIAVVLLVTLIRFRPTIVRVEIKEKNLYPGVHQYINYSVGHFGLQPLIDVEPLNPDFGDVFNDVTSFKYPITIPPCRGVPTNRSILIAVVSAPSYFDKRDLIRKTWMTTFKSMHDEGVLKIVGFGFIVGLTGNDTIQRKIEKESRIYGDIIQIDMIDTYRNLCTKTIGLLNWVYQYCSLSIDFVLKVDDDVFVNARNVLQFLNENLRQPNYNIYTSTFNDAPPHRDGKWEISKEQWPWRNFPTFASGGSVLMPKDIIFPLMAASQTIPKIPLEDVYLIGLCVEKAEIVIQSSQSILAMGYPLIPDACQLRTSITWLTESSTHMNNSQVATEDFYTNRTQCVRKKKEKIISTTDFGAPVQLTFSTRTEKTRKSKKKYKIRIRFG